MTADEVIALWQVGRQVFGIAITHPSYAGGRFIRAALPLGTGRNTVCCCPLGLVSIMAGLSTDPMPSHNKAADLMGLPMDDVLTIMRAADGKGFAPSAQWEEAERTMRQRLA